MPNADANQGFARGSGFRTVEFFSGLGGWRRALEGLGGPNGPGQIIAAYDVSEVANAAYARSFGAAPRTRELAAVPASEIVSLNADAWLMSPPCQPFCRRGSGRDLADPRSAALLHLLDVLPEARPRLLVLENVEGFLESDAYALLCERLSQIGLGWRALRLCPTQFGIPNRRPRVYVAARAGGVDECAPPPDMEPRPIGDYLDPIEDESLYVPPAVLARHRPGMDLVGPGSRRSACFIGGYGKVFVGGGSFLETPRGARRFSPGEIARLMGHPPDVGFPPGAPLNTKYRLLGNGLSVLVAAWMLERLSTSFQFPVFSFQNEDPPLLEGHETVAPSDN
jgi:site-specific DNA-cytosine methylase